MVMFDSNLLYLIHILCFHETLCCLELWLFICRDKIKHQSQIKAKIHSLADAAIDSLHSIVRPLKPIFCCSKYFTNYSLDDLDSSGDVCRLTDGNYIACVSIAETRFCTER